MTASSSPNHHNIRLMGGRAHHYVNVGSSGPRVVLLHGFTDSWRSFELLFAALGAKFHLFAFDQRGHGASDAADSYAISDFAADAIAFRSGPGSADASTLPSAVKARSRTISCPAE